MTSSATNVDFQSNPVKCNAVDSCASNVASNVELNSVIDTCVTNVELCSAGGATYCHSSFPQVSHTVPGSEASNVIMSTGYIGTSFPNVCYAFHHGISLSPR